MENFHRTLKNNNDHRNLKSHNDNRFDLFRKTEKPHNR